MPPILHIELLGVPTVSQGRVPLSTIATEKAKLLLFYLILFRGMKHTRPALAGLFWGDSTEPQARRALNTALWRLRQWMKSLRIQVESTLWIEDQEIGFNRASRCWVDVIEFEERMTWAEQMMRRSPEQAAAAFQAAVHLYRGPLLEGCYLEWCLVERDRLQQLFIRALLQLMEYHDKRQEYAQAIAYAQRILADNPLDEEIQRALIKLFLSNHQPAKALQQYHRCEAILRQELGIQPMPETCALVQEVALQLVGKIDLWPVPSLPSPEKVSAEGRPLVEQIILALDRFEVARAELIDALEAFHQQRNDL
jgi:DNA-binding SARP family transcriptional activator